MAKKLVKKWKFTPGAPGFGTITIPGAWSLEKFLLITNVTRGEILYNFADTANTGGTAIFQPGGVPTQGSDTSVVTYPEPWLGRYTGTAKIQTVVSGIGETTITLSIDTSSQNANDQLSILVEDEVMYTRPWNDFGTDAIERIRVSLPENMIDADFEYGLQPSKWQSFQWLNQYPSTYEVVTNDLTISSIKTSGNTYSLITVNSVGHPLSVGNPITVAGLDQNIVGFQRAEGAFLVFSANTDYFTYFAKGQVGSVDDTGLNTIRSQLRRGGFYSGADLPISYVASDGADPSNITVTFTTPHGFVPGNPILISADTTWNGANASLLYLPGAYNTNAIVSSNQIQFTARGQVAPAGSANIGNIQVSNTGSIKMYVRNDGFFTHRAGDGGLILGPGSPVHGASAARQSKTYFRYQSGKGFLFTTGVMFAPNYDIVSVTMSPNTNTTNINSLPVITVVTAIPNGVQPGATVRIRGVATAGYDGQYVVETVVDAYTIQFKAIYNQIYDSVTGAVTNVPKLYLYKWQGACIRTGPHDEANGMFFEYDGAQFNAVKRTSTLQLAGTATFVPNSTQIVGTNTLWTQQLKIGDKIVLKGMVHRVSAVLSDTEINVAPDYRGVNVTTNNYIWRVIDERVGQPNFNRDTVDGTNSIYNPSGYKLDPNHMQMVGIQFTWYGAGFMDYMVRGPEGNFIIMHRAKQNNINITASMRTGSHPVRYQVGNEASAGVTAISRQGSAMSPVSTSITVDDASLFPDSGYVLVENEIIQYTSKVTTSTPNTLNGCTREVALPLYIDGVLRNFYGVPAGSHNVGTGVELVSCTATPSMSHWGSSYIIDGRLDWDRRYLFNYTAVDCNVTTSTSTVMGLRLAPSASNALVGDLGDRELLNRAQILLDSVAVNCADQSTTGNVTLLITGILNPSNYNETSQTWYVLNSAATGNQPSLAQVANTFAFTSGTTAQPGEQLFQFTVNPTQGYTHHLIKIKELAQSAIGGRGTYPNGADSLMVTVQALPGASAPNTFVSNVHITLNWIEAQN